MRIHHQNALAQMLHDELVQLGEIGDVDFTQPHQLFAFAQAPGQRTDAECDDEYQRARDAGCGEISKIGTLRQHSESLLQE